MSSAILYLAIIAIWLCVLVPRWLKRDSARGAGVAPEAAALGDSPVTAADGDGEADLADDGTAQADDDDVVVSPAFRARRRLPWRLPPRLPRR